MLSRTGYENRSRASIRRSPTTALLGPRQSGKTTLAWAIAKDLYSRYSDLEPPEDAKRLQNPELTLGSLTGLVVIDEIWFMPQLFPVLRVPADRNPGPARFLILGSASPALRDSTSESLGGRMEFVDRSGFSLEEVGEEDLVALWVRGGFPR